MCQWHVQVGIRQAFYTGLSLGLVHTIVYCTYAVAFYYGAWRVKVGAYTGGDVMNVLVAALLGGFSLGQVRGGGGGVVFGGLGGSGKVVGRQREKVGVEVGKWAWSRCSLGKGE